MSISLWSNCDQTWFNRCGVVEGLKDSLRNYDWELPVFCFFLPTGPVDASGVIGWSPISASSASSESSVCWDNAEGPVKCSIWDESADLWEESTSISSISTAEQTNLKCSRAKMSSTFRINLGVFHLFPPSSNVGKMSCMESTHRWYVVLFPSMKG